MTTLTENHIHPLAFTNVNIDGGFWAEKQATNRDKTIPSIHHHLEETGRTDSLHLKPGQEAPDFQPVVRMFWDSDTGKYIESVAYSLATHPNPELERQTDELIDLIESAQQEDGYLNTYFTAIAPEDRWANVRDWHEMYNAGHLVEGAVAYYAATGKDKLLKVLKRFIDHIDERFGPSDGKKRGYPGHPELEMALVRLYNATNEARYLDLATYFMNERGQEPHYFDQEAAIRGDDPTKFWAKTYHYCQAHAPLREQDEAVGHSVRACYLYAGLADIARETKDSELLEISKKLWDDLTTHQMYITGGLGPAQSNEGFTFAYDLPNETAYAETYASIALAFWAHRMFHLDPDGRYIDVMERATLNGVLSGVSTDGTQFFYANPLSSHPHVNPQDPWIGITGDEHYRRKDWFFCPCCPAPTTSARKNACAAVGFDSGS